jgi:hypothetical protein
VVGDVELGRISAALAVTDLGAIDRQMECAVDSIEAQPDLRADSPVRWDAECLSVCSNGIFSRDKWRVDGKRIRNVGVLGLAEALQLPVAGHLDGLPILYLVKRSWCVLEVPRAVQKKRVFRNPIGPSWQTIAQDNQLVAIIWCY